MTATNHALTGALIAVALPSPAIAFPLALLSHFVLDATPHFGKHPKMHYTSRAFMIFLAIDLAIAFMVLTAVSLAAPGAFWLPFVSGLIAVSPDALWFPGYVRNLRGKKPLPLGPISRFHLKIQWAELPQGWIYEIVWFATMLLVLAKVLLIW